MSAKRLGRALRVLRHRARLTQKQLGQRAGVSASTVSRIEGGEILNASVGTIVALFEAVDARVEMKALWHGAALDRLIDEGHARLGGRIVALLGDAGWACEVEVSFSRYGERGSFDILAWHAPTRSLLVVEIKTELASLDGLLRPMDAKVRLAPVVARERFGWRAARVGRTVVFPDRPGVRRQVARHAGMIDAALPDRSRAARRWLREPEGEVRAVWFLSDLHGMQATSNPSAVRRVRPRRSAAT